MSLASHEIAREHMLRLRADAERAHVARAVRVARRRDRQARAAVLRADRAQAELLALQL